MHEPGDSVIVTDNGLAVAPGLHTLFDIAYTVVSIHQNVIQYRYWNSCHLLISAKTETPGNYTAIINRRCDVKLL